MASKSPQKCSSANSFLSKASFDNVVFYNDYVLWIVFVDNVGLSRAEVTLDGELVESRRFNDTKTDYLDHLLDVSEIPNGAHTVTISVNDVNGNTAEETYTLTVDKPGFLYRLTVHILVFFDNIFSMLAGG